MKSISIAILMILASISISCGEEASSRPLASLEPFIGKWQGEMNPSDGPQGTVTVDIEDAGLGTFITMTARFAIKAQGEAASILTSITRINGESTKLWTWFHGPDGHLQGPTLVDGNRMSSKAQGFTSDGKRMSASFEMVVDGNELTMSRSQSVVAESKLPDEEMRLTLVSRPDSDNVTATADKELLKEIQGIWRLDRGKGGWNEKKIDGSSEVLTRYDRDGNVEESHRVKFQLTHENGAKHYSILAMEFTAGPKKGTIVPKVFLRQFPGYQYRVTPSTFIEVQKGQDGNSRTFEWQRVDKEPASE